MTRISIIVKPGSSQEKIVEAAPNELIVYLRAKPHDGEANTALFRLLSKYFGIPKTTIRIIRGTKSRNKIVEI